MYWIDLFYTFQQSAIDGLSQAFDCDFFCPSISKGVLHTSRQQLLSSFDICLLFHCVHMTKRLTPRVGLCTPTTWWHAPCLCCWHFSVSSVVHYHSVQLLMTILAYFVFLFCCCLFLLSSLHVDFSCFCYARHQFWLGKNSKQLFTGLKLIRNTVKDGTAQNNIEDIRYCAISV